MSTLGLDRRTYTISEDRTIKQYAGVKTAEEIGLMIGRTKNSVHCRIKLLKLDGRLRGENHHNAKLSNLQTAMLITLYEAGFSVNEIQQAAFSHVTVGCVNDVACARTRKEAIA